jgi:hypothetical protein
MGKCDFERRRYTQGLHKKENEHANQLSQSNRCFVTLIVPLQSFSNHLDAARHNKTVLL